ncbi:hypothetical protein ACFVWP_06940 [Streptomyces sp. NPDC058175]|uniref:hypothetical protein n=1 Tax=Streptomyces sp. NPDC058175 TaxID=3346367 RepID=UPI0036ED7BB6
MAALTGLLVRACCKLLPARELVPLWREHRGGAVVLTVTAFAIVATNLFKGVLVGLAPAVARTAWDISHVQVRTEDRGLGAAGLRGCGAGRTGGRHGPTFLGPPKLLDALEALPADRDVRLELGEPRRLDHACATALEGEWRGGARADDGVVRLRGGRPPVS